MLQGGCCCVACSSTVKCPHSNRFKPSVNINEPAGRRTAGFSHASLLKSERVGQCFGLFVSVKSWKKGGYMQEKCVHFMVHSMSLWLDYIYMMCACALYYFVPQLCVRFGLQSHHQTWIHAFGGQLLSVWGYLHHFSPRGWKYNRIFLMSMQCQGLPAPWTVTHVSPLWWHWCSAELSHCNLGYIKLSYSWDVTFFLSVERENPESCFFYSLGDAANGFPVLIKLSIINSSPELQSYWIYNYIKWKRAKKQTNKTPLTFEKVNFVSLLNYCKSANDHSIFVELG